MNRRAVIPLSLSLVLLSIVIVFIYYHYCGHVLPIVERVQQQQNNVHNANQRTWITFLPTVWMWIQHYAFNSTIRINSEVTMPDTIAQNVYQRYIFISTSKRYFLNRNSLSFFALEVHQFLADSVFVAAAAISARALHNIFSGTYPSESPAVCSFVCN